MIHEIELKDTEHYEGLVEITKADPEIIPLFLKTTDGDLKIIPADSKKFTDIEKGSRLVYLGKMFDIVNGADSIE